MNKELKSITEAAVKWFESKSTEKNREEYFERGKLGDTKKGAVYVYYDNKKALYVGETSRSIKSRMHDETSPHKKADWWKDWTIVRFINIENRTDRLLLEILLIIGLQSKNNTKPGPRDVNKMFTK